MVCVLDAGPGVVEVVIPQDCRRWSPTGIAYLSVNMGDSATQESFTPTVARLVAGEFDVGAGYATYRSRGTTDWLLMHTLDGEGRLGTDGPDVRALPGSTTL